MERRAYINDFLYVVLRPDDTSGGDVLIFCSGVNITRFRALTRGLHGLSSNPAIRGLQRVKHAVTGLALSEGATPRAVRGKECSGTAPTDDTWYTEILRIESAPPSLPPMIVPFAVSALVEKILTGCCLNIPVPSPLPDPAELQSFLESLIKP